MTISTESNNKVVDLQQRQGLHASETDRLGDLLKTARTAALKRICALVCNLFDNIDDALFDLAEKAENNSVQNHYFDGMREVRKKRQLVDRLFQEQISSLFNDFASGKLQAIQADAPQMGTHTGLALLDDLELEESLAINSMVAKTATRFARGLYGLNQRLSVIRAGAPVEDASNPIGPAPLCNAFRIALQEFEITVAVKLIVLKLFERYVLAGLEPLYDEVNALLIKAGVLPQTQYLTQSRAPSAPNNGYAGGIDQNYGLGRQQQPTGYSQQEMQDPAAVASAQWQVELYQSLRQMLANRHAPPAPEYLGNTFAQALAHHQGLPLAHAPQPQDLLNALTLLQQQTFASEQAHAKAAAANPLATIGQVQQVKQELLGQLNKLSAESAQVSHADEDTIDLVGMLFEFILQDRNLPSEMQALLARLQIPYLKLALLDRHLFAQKTHPARRLLDAMAEASIGWSADSDPDQRLYQQVKHTVTELLQNFDDDVGIFDRLHRDFAAFVNSQRRRIDLTEQRVTEAARGREKLSVARISASREIRERLEDKPLSDLVRHVLARPWSNYLTLVFLRSGEHSGEWQEAVRFMDDLIWSVTPKYSQEDRAQLKSMLPTLESTLRHGLTTVAYHDSDMRRVIEDLRKLHARVLIAKPSAEVKTEHTHSYSAGAAANDAQTSAEVAEAAEDRYSVQAQTDTTNSNGGVDVATPYADAEYEPGASNAPVSAFNAEVQEIFEDDEYFEQARTLKVGTWLQFIHADTGVRERAKLSWISPISARYLFVNGKGLKVADKSIHALAQDLRDGNAILLVADVPLFDRALGAIVERLKAEPASI